MNKFDFHLSKLSFIRTKILGCHTVGVKENPKGFKVQEPTAEEFQFFLNHIEYNQDYKAKDFMKSTVSRLWTVLMHFIILGLFGKHGGTDTLTKDWLYVVYSIDSGCNNDVDLPEVLWQDFRKFAIKRKSNEISCPRFWALTIQQLYRERFEPIPLSMIP